jgi:hypothetical protein
MLEVHSACKQGVQMVVVCVGCILHLQAALTKQGAVLLHSIMHSIRLRVAPAECDELCGGSSRGSIGRCVGV